MSARSRKRGFTLVELMIVVAIVGVLAAVGVFLLNKHMFASKSVEASAMIQSIRAAEERWRAENQSYLDVSTAMDSWYPMKSPGRDKWAWVNPDGNDAGRWRLLNATAPGPVQFGYVVKAGEAGSTPPKLLTKEQPDWPVSPEPWYLVQAKADADGDGDPAYFAASSYSGEIYVENEGE
jgi:type IV pilus assembly protein PilA